MINLIVKSIRLILTFNILTFNIKTMVLYLIWQLKILLNTFIIGRNIHYAKKQIDFNKIKEVMV